MNEICIFSLFGFYNFFYCTDNIYLKIDKELKEFEFGTHILLAIDNDYLRWLKLRYMKENMPNKFLWLSST